MGVTCPNSYVISQPTRMRMIIPSSAEKSWNSSCQGSWLILAWIEPADASRVLLDCSQGRIERKVRPMPHAGHGLQSMAVRVDCKLLVGCLCNAPHRAA